MEQRVSIERMEEAINIFGSFVVFFMLKSSANASSASMSEGSRAVRLSMM